MKQKLGYSFLLAFFLGIVAFAICINIENKQKLEFEKEITEFRTNWKADIEQKQKARMDILVKLTTICQLSTHWLEYKELYLQRAENSGKDISSKMFDDMALNPYHNYSIISDFIMSYYHRDSDERELLRKYDSPSYDYEINETLATPQKLQSFETFKAWTTKNPIYTKAPIENAFFVFIVSLIILTLLNLIFIKR